MQRGSKEDLKYINKLIKENNLAVPGKDKTKFKNKLFKETVNLLDQNWEDISILVHLLFKKRRIEFYDIKNSLIKKSNNKIYWKTKLKLVEKVNSTEFFLDEQILKKLLS